MRTIEHTIDIPVAASDVWDVVTATDEYAQWNPFMPRLDGELRTGERLHVTIQPGRRKMSFRPTVVAVEPGALLRWQGRLGVRGIFDGEHELRVEPTADGGSRFIQRETFTGLLVPFLRRTLDDTAAGFAAMNHALRDRAIEKRAASR